MRAPILVLVVALTAGLTGTAASAAPATHREKMAFSNSSAAAARPEPAPASQHRASVPADPDPRPAPAAICPAAPGGTLRQGAAQFGFDRLCHDSIRQASTPQAAAAVTFALAHLGLPYSQRRRNEATWFDCSSYMARAYQSAGVPLAPAGRNASTTWMLLDMRGGRLSTVAYRDARPGDLIFPKRGHVAMVLSHGFMAHTNHNGDVSHIRRLYGPGSTYVILRVHA